MRFRGQKAGLHTICGSKICLEVIRGRIHGQKGGLRTSYESKMALDFEVRKQDYAPSVDRKSAWK